VRLCAVYGRIVGPALCGIVAQSPAVRITRQTLGCGRLHIVQIIPHLELLSSVSAGFACLFVLLCVILEQLRVSGRGFQSVAKRRLSSANFAKEFDDWVMLYPFEDAQNNWVSYRGKSLETC